MFWDVDIVRRPDTELVDADYWSHLDVDLNFDPLYHKYLQLTHHMRKSKPAPTDIPMRQENMPYFRGPRIQKPSLKSSLLKRITFRVFFLTTLCWMVKDIPFCQIIL